MNKNALWITRSKPAPSCLLQTLQIFPPKILFAMLPFSKNIISFLAHGGGGCVWGSLNGANIWTWGHTPLCVRGPNIKPDKCNQTNATRGNRVTSHRYCNRAISEPTEFLMRICKSQYQRGYPKICWKGKRFSINFIVHNSWLCHAKYYSI